MKILLVADRAPEALQLERLVHLAWGPLRSSVYLTDGDKNPADWLRANEADAIVVDPGSTGLGWLRPGSAHAAATVVVADDPGLAVTAFETGVADFVQTAASRERLAQALRRALASGGREERRARRLAVRKAGRVELVPVDDLLYARGADNYSEIVLGNGRRELHDETLAALAVRLVGEFERVHKSYLVRVSAMRRLTPRPGNHHAVELANGEVLPVGRTRYAALRRRLFD
jgi:DNA-binding LytR/AlgR family response regulator